MRQSLDQNQLNQIYANLQKANSKIANYYPGESGDRQPVHTVYGGAHLFKSALVQKLGDLGIRALDTYGKNFTHFAKLLQMKKSETLPDSENEIDLLAEKVEKDPKGMKKENRTAWLAYSVYKRVQEKLAQEPVEDFRIDFEDGYGNRSNEEEDRHAEQAAEQVAKGMQNNTLPPFIGIRLKPFTQELKERGIRTLDIFLSTLNELTDGRLPNNFVVTIPKVTIPEQVEAVIDVFSAIESKTRFETGSLKLELMVETTQSIIDQNGLFTIPMLVNAGKGRVIGCHFGTYDYTASCNITAAYQSISHPTCDFARNVMQITLANTGITISDGATTIMPIAPHKATEEGTVLTPEQLEENERVVKNAWKRHFDNIMNSFLFGFYQSWDLNPAQLPIRYAAIYVFFLENLDQASKRLSAFIDQAAQATLVGDIFDDAATGQGLLNYFLRALSCRALKMNEISEVGLTPEEIRTRSFVQILAKRRSA